MTDSRVRIDLSERRDCWLPSISQPLEALAQGQTKSLPDPFVPKSDHDMHTYIYIYTIHTYLLWVVRAGHPRQPPALQSAFEQPPMCMYVYIYIYIYICICTFLSPCFSRNNMCMQYIDMCVERTYVFMYTSKTRPCKIPAKDHFKQSTTRLYWIADKVMAGGPRPISFASLCEI